jgi:hypothetical protein
MTFLWVVLAILYVAMFFWLGLANDAQERPWLALLLRDLFSDSVDRGRLHGPDGPSYRRLCGRDRHLSRLALRHTRARKRPLAPRGMRARQRTPLTLTL